MVAANRELIRAINQFNILNTIRKSGTISRVEIAQITGQSRALVTNITADLIRQELIYEKAIKDSAQRGRRRVLLALNPEAAFVVGVKLSELRISCAVTDMQADVKSAVILPVRTGKRPVEFLADLIEEGIRHCVSDARLRLSKIAGIGLGLPGFIDSQKRICHWTPLYQNAKAHLHDMIQERLNIPTYIENDANAVTMAHQWFGEGRGIDNFIVITLEDGVGMGIVVNGQMYRGAGGFGGEFGHTVVVPGGVPCRCGKSGCVEAYASDFSILAAAKRACSEGEWDCGDAADLSFDDVLAAAKNGESALIEVFRLAGSVLGLGISGLVQVFNPARIIISGEGVRAGDLLFGPMREAMEKYVNRQALEMAKIVIHKWQDTDWARGAASLVLQELYKHPFSRAHPMI
jgi:predicted NBD/HSP70 family sugar kinase